ncbi:MAG: aminoglycoside phosphotransferase family protein, partial [Deltaproteobacteria bacterium]|nr:aminoglycoside phosphotransferase family protein [Deltaproteobacteria bacterium]
MDLAAKVETYLQERFGHQARLLAMAPLGEGVHGTAHRVVFQTPQGENRLIMKALFHSRFGHDHYADRAQVLLLAQANYNEMPKHVRATDVVGETPDRLISVRDAREFYIFMEEADGVSYFEDLEAILRRGRLSDLDRQRARMLAQFIAEVHANRYRGPNAGVLYRRRIRDLIGHGECIMGIIDAYEPVDFATDAELVSYAARCLPWWGR